jgi:hypothetical protein
MMPMNVFSGLGSRLILGLLLAASVAPSALDSGPAQDKTPRPMPPHDYWLARLNPAEPGRASLIRVRDSILATLGSSGILPTGFPKSGRIVLTPLRSEPGVSTQSCVPSDQAGTDSACLLLHPDGSFLNLFYLTYPDTRAYLFEVYLFPKPPRLPVNAQERYSRDRVVVHHPVFVGDTWPRTKETGLDLLGLLQQGLLQSGARPITFTRN